MLLKPELVELAVDLQKRSYALLRWVAERVDRGTLGFNFAHDYATLPEAAHGWLDSQYETLPRDAQPAREHLRAFANLFTSYLETSFDLLESPGQHKYSPDDALLLSHVQLARQRASARDEEARAGRQATRAEPAVRRDQRDCTRARRRRRRCRGDARR